MTDGVCGRVAGDFRKDKPDKNGLSSFASAIQRAGRLDVIIIALGTNDLQQKHHQTVDDIIKSLLAYRQVAKSITTIFILPPTFDIGDVSGPEFTENSEKIRQQLLQRQDELGNRLELPDINLSDGIHFSPKGHYQVFKTVRRQLKLYL